jgi:hypothetical protein
MYVHVDGDKHEIDSLSTVQQRYQPNLVSCRTRERAVAHDTIELYSAETATVEVENMVPCANVHDQVPTDERLSVGNASVDQYESCFSA